MRNVCPSKICYQICEVCGENVMSEGNSKKWVTIYSTENLKHWKHYVRDTEQNMWITAFWSSVCGWPHTHVKWHVFDFSSMFDSVILLTVLIWLSEMSICFCWPEVWKWWWDEAFVNLLVFDASILKLVARYNKGSW